MDDLREKVAMAMAPKVFMDFDPMIHGSLVTKKAAMESWLLNADDAILAVLEALKEPSEAMLEAGGGEGGFDGQWMVDNTSDIWKAMITAFAQENGKAL